MPIDQLSKELNQPRLFSVGLYKSSPDSPRKDFSEASNAADLLLYLLETTHQEKQQSLLKIEALYDQRLFSSSRISFILEQLVQLVKNAAMDYQLSVGKIDLMTESQSELLPDPKQDLHWLAHKFLQ